MDRLGARLDQFETETRGRFDAIDVRLDRIEVRLDRFEGETHGRFDAIDVRFGRFDVDFGAVILDHGRRLRSLEGSGGS
jgi:hypothetical protein